MIDFKNQKKTYLLIAVFSAAILAVVLLVIYPLIGQIKKSSEELARNRQDTEIFFANWQDLKKSQEITKEIKNKLDELNPVLPKGEAIKFIEALENIAARTNNKQKIDVAGQNAKAKDLIDFQISLQGNYLDLIKFLINLEAIPYNSEIKTINISGVNAEQGGSGNIKTLINLSVLTKENEN